MFLLSLTELPSSCCYKLLENSAVYLFLLSLTDLPIRCYSKLLEFSAVPAPPLLNWPAKQLLLQAAWVFSCLPVPPLLDWPAKQLLLRAVAVFQLAVSRASVQHPLAMNEIKQSIQWCYTGLVKPRRSRFFEEYYFLKRPQYLKCICKELHILMSD